MTRILIEHSTVYFAPVSKRAMRVKVWGAGGGGAGGSANVTQCWGGGSGGGGAYVSAVLSFHKAVGVPLEVGAGGVAGGAGSPGGPGGASAVGRLRPLFAPGGGGGPAANPETGAAPAAGGQASTARGRIRASGGAGNVSLVNSPSSEGSGGGGAGGRNGDGGYGLGGSDFVQGAGGFGGPDGGDGGHGGDSPYFTGVAAAEAGFVPGGGGGGGGAGLVLHPPIVQPLTLSFYVGGDRDGEGNFILGPQLPEDGIIRANLATLATWTVPATPLALVFLLRSGPHRQVHGVSDMYFLAWGSFGAAAWYTAGGVYSEYALVRIETEPTYLYLVSDGTEAEQVENSPWVFSGDYYAIDSDGSQSTLSTFSISVTFLPTA